MKENIKQEIVIPEGINVSYIDEVLLVKGPQGEVKKGISYPTIVISVDNGQILLSSENGTKRERRMIGTFNSHIKNMLQGVKEKFVCKLKICSGHFPMNVSISGKDFIVKNFLGEKHPRVVTFPDSVNVKLTGQEVEVTGCSKEEVGQTAGSIEKMCRINNKDLRIFQDGIYIIEKA